MTKIKPAQRDYNFNDSHLIQLADGTMILITRDEVYFIKRGHTPAKSANLKLLRDEFAATKPDEYYLAIVGVKKEEKDAARTALTTVIRTIFVAAENVYGVDCSTYRSFGKSSLTRLNDEEMIRNSRLVVSTARDNLADLAEEGITDEMLDGADTLIESLDKALDAQLTAQYNRDKATTDRITKGNALYHAIVKVCNTGKDIWYETNESLYNDYVIYNTPSGQPEPTGLGSIRGKITDAEDNLLEGVACRVLNTEIEAETDEFGEYEMLEVPVGKHSMEFELAGFEKYTDEIVEVFENQETMNDIELTQTEEPVVP